MVRNRVVKLSVIDKIVRAKRVQFGNRFLGVGGSALGLLFVVVMILVSIITVLACKRSQVRCNNGYVQNWIVSYS